MRESKYRGKRVDNGEWVYGSLLQSEIAGNGYCKCAIVCRFADSYNVGEHEVIPETVGQLSRDSAGNEIYEGDYAVIESQIFIPMEGSEGVVKFIESGFYVDNGTETHPVWSDAYELTVIGNIHDNPKLLKDGTT